MARWLTFTETRWFAAIETAAAVAFFLGAGAAFVTSALAGDWLVAAPWGVAILWAVMALLWRQLSRDWRKLFEQQSAHYAELATAAMGDPRDLRRDLRR